MIATVALGLLLWLHPTGEGGRLRPIVADPAAPFRLRPGWRLPGPGAPDQSGAPVFGFDRAVIHPGGGPVKAVIAVPYPDQVALWRDRAGPGAQLLLYDGPRRHGVARVVWRSPAHWPVTDDEASTFRDWLGGGRVPDAD